MRISFYIFYIIFIHFSSLFSILHQGKLLLGNLELNLFLEVITIKFGLLEYIEKVFSSRHIIKKMCLIIYLNTL